METTRDRILDAAAELMRTRGIVRTTTKEIAKAAGFSEATLYKHFRDKEELLLAGPARAHAGLRRHTDVAAGEGDGRGQPLRAGHAAHWTSTARAFPMLGSLLSEPQLMAAHRESLRKYGAGPARAVENIAGYLDAEQTLGRVPADADPAAVGRPPGRRLLPAGLPGLLRRRRRRRPGPRTPPSTALTKALSGP